MDNKNTAQEYPIADRILPEPLQTGEAVPQPVAEPTPEAAPTPAASASKTTKKK